MFTFAASNIIMKKMDKNVLNLNTSSVVTKFWPELKVLSNRDKLSLIVMLSSSMTPLEEEAAKPVKGWTKSFAGQWQDDRSSEEIIADIRAARTTNHFDVEI